MLGGMLAGHKEGETSIIEKMVKIYRILRHELTNCYGKALAESQIIAPLKVKNCHVPYKGVIKNTLQDILGGMRSTCLRRSRRLKRTQQENHLFKGFRARKPNILIITFLMIDNNSLLFLFHSLKTYHTKLNPLQRVFYLLFATKQSIKT